MEIIEPMTFMECLAEAYKKRIMGRTEFKVGNQVKIVVNPDHEDISKYYNNHQKPKRKKDKPL